MSSNEDDAFFKSCCFPVCLITTFAVKFDFFFLSHFRGGLSQDLVGPLTLATCREATCVLSSAEAPGCVCDDTGASSMENSMGRNCEEQSSQDDRGDDFESRGGVGLC